MAVVFPDVITQHELLDYHCEKRARYAADVRSNGARKPLVSHVRVAQSNRLTG